MKAVITVERTGETEQDARMPSDSPRPVVLVVDDDPTVREVVRRYLTRDGMTVIEAARGDDGLAAFHHHRPDLVVLDLMLPGVDGLDVCRVIRTESTVPVIMLTALGEESDRVVGLEYGADDYVTKPFSPRELALRVGGVLRRARPAAVAPAAVARPGFSPAPAQMLLDGDLSIDVTARSATRSGDPLSLTVREFDLLCFLLNNPAKAFTRAELMEQVWGWTFGDTATVTVHVRRLREKIEADPADPARIVTVWGVGYRYQPAVDR